MIDVLVAGGGPAGWAVAAACARMGLDTELVDPAPDRPWRATYGSWRGELPADASRSSGAAAARCGHRHYGAPARLGLRGAGQRSAARGVRRRAGQVVKGRVRDARPDRGGVTVDFDGGRGRQPCCSTQPVRRVRCSARLCADCRRADRGRCGGRRRRCPRSGDPGDALFMDWRPHHGEAGWPTFLYAVPVTPDRVLLEETSRPAVPGSG